MTTSPYGGHDIGKSTVSFPGYWNRVKRSSMSEPDSASLG